MSVASVGAHFIIYANRSGACRSKNITRMSQSGIDAYARYSPSLIHNGGKP